MVAPYSHIAHGFHIFEISDLFRWHEKGVPAKCPVMLMPLSPAFWKFFDIPKSDMRAMFDVSKYWRLNVTMNEAI